VPKREYNAISTVNFPILFLWPGVLLPEVVLTEKSLGRDDAIGACVHRCARLSRYKQIERRKKKKKKKKEEKRKKGKKKEKEREERKERRGGIPAEDPENVTSEITTRPRVSYALR